MREPAVKKTLYWCDHCNVPLIGRSCGCGAEGRAISLLQPYDVRPALAADRELIRSLVHGTFGPVPLPKIILLNKTGGLDRADLVIMHGDRFGWLTFDPVSRQFSLDIAPEALPYLVPHATRGIVSLEKDADLGTESGRIGGKRFPLKKPVDEGTVIVTYKNRVGTGAVKQGFIRVKEVMPVAPRTPPDPDWSVAIAQNRYHLKNLERNAVRTIRQHMHDRPCINVSFSGGKDSMAALTLARKAGVTKAFFIDTGIEFPETVAFVEAQGVDVIRKGGDFWQAAEKAGPPGKDHRWCCKLQKLHPLKLYLETTGPCVTVQGNRWYESWNRADLEETSQNPANPLQLNISPIRSWRALEVFLYLWWQQAPLNPLYEKGIERIGCMVCPAMLESEYEELRRMHPECAMRWDDLIDRWAGRKGLPGEYRRWGLWRWKALPPKMRELCRNRGIPVNEDYTLHTSPPGKSPGATGRERTMQPEKETGPEVLPVDAIRKDFPILGDIIYLDSAATGFSPEPVIEAMAEYEHHYRANVGRGVHRYTRIATQRYWHAHEKVAKLINGTHGTTVFTKNTTEAVNMVARGLAWKPGDRVVTTILEHHSNLLPWRALAKKGVDLEVIGINPDHSLDLAALETALSAQVRLVALTHASNVLGVITPVGEIARMCRKNGALLLVDAAQSVPHLPVDAKALDCDFLCFSGHKMLGPTGTGVLWMKEPVIEPSTLGGGMVESVSAEGYIPAGGYETYEAGTPNISGGIGLGVAAEYLAAIGLDRIHRHEGLLTTRLIDGLRGIDRVKVYAPEQPDARIGVVSFTIEGMHPHEVAQQLDDQADILVRSGYHCCQPLMEYLGLPDGTVRASFALYTTEQEVDLLLAGIRAICRGI
jgi:cysteine desulfurase/selenocysteine lyase